NPTTTHEQYAPPLQGQPNPSGPIDLIQQNYWDEKNQLRGLWNLSGLHHYIYDADGQRLMKSSVPMSYSSVNAQQLQATNSIAAEDYTVYVSAGLVYESNRGSTTYTKHYYAGPLRVASQIGSANPNYETHPIGGQIAPGGPSNTTPESYGVAILSDLNTLLANYGMAVNANEPPQDTLSMQVISNPDECKIYYGDDVIEENRCLCDNFPDIAIQQGINCNPYTPIYWYHPDYIGNIEFVTDRTGQPYQHFYYAAFGDPLVSQHVGTGSFNSAFRFNAKEYDEETGNYYYGARYYEPKSSVWMGVDALATSYPSMNPYNFVLGNPIMAMDPDGDTVDVTSSDGALLFRLYDGKEELRTVTAREAYAEGIQWFSPQAENYMPILKTYEGLYTERAKHFYKSDIEKFASKDRSNFSYRSGGSGDWKAENKPGDGYLLSTMDGFPYWTDALGQIPFAANLVRKNEEDFTDQNELINDCLLTIFKYGDGNPFSPEADATMSYDNLIALRAILWQINGRNLSNPVTSNEVLILTKAINVFNSQVD
ncbi:RHS repeat-associated core domain-containing protein, partial [Schleiferiaceae bacterium]|nr:RHS repeat-associated core domain-containing protein [Schleiferiaceae bacterium]MDC3318099.1 RHS repeat-associated core domain-containing protein [Schleiferiaceae bacterium]